MYKKRRCPQVLRTGAIRTSNVHSVDAITALSLVHFYVRSRDQFSLQFYELHLK